MVAPVISITSPMDVCPFLIKNTRYAGNRVKKNIANLLHNLHRRRCGGMESTLHFDALDIDTVFGSDAGFWVMETTLLDGNFDTFRISRH